MIYLTDVAHRSVWVPYLAGLFGVTIFTIAAFVNIDLVINDITRPAYTSHYSTLADLALEKVLNDAAPVFGESDNGSEWTAGWMSRFSDDTEIVHMNLPGTHDSATWNYSKETQESLQHAIQLLGGASVNASFLRCQRKSLNDMLNAGIRVFDLRYAYDITNTTLTFWHGPGLMSQTATVDDVLFGFYNWLDNHPEEAVFLSFQYQGMTRPHASDDAGVQQLLYNALMRHRSYFVQSQGMFGTLGEARGKITLLRRFVLDQPHLESALPGVQFSPLKWTDNSPDIELVYNTSDNAIAFIEDYYWPQTPHGSSAAHNIEVKYNATISHLERAANTHPDSLFWTFASSTNLFNGPPITPAIQALGNGTDTPDGGVNHQLIKYLTTMKGKRLGMLMIDFYEEPAALVPTFLDLLTPEQAGPRKSPP